MYVGLYINELILSSLCYILTSANTFLPVLQFILVHDDTIAVKV